MENEKKKNAKKKKKPNENWTIEHNLQDLRLIGKGIWKASIKKKKTQKN